MWAGVAGAVVNNNTGFEIAISVHDSVYNTDFASSIIPYDAKDPEEQATAIEKHTLDVLRKFSSEHMCKFLGAGITLALLREVRDAPVSPLLALTFAIEPEHLHAPLARSGHCPHRIQHQAVPHGLAHASQHQAPHLVYVGLVRPVWRGDAHGLR